MRLSQFNESLEKLGEARLTEADEDSKKRRKEIIKDRFEKLEQTKQLIAKSLQNLSIIKDMDKFNNYITVLEWIYKVSHPLKDLVSSNVGDEEFKKKVKYSDLYIKQILDSVKGGKLVYESLLTESLNYISK